MSTARFSFSTPVEGFSQEIRYYIRVGIWFKSKIPLERKSFTLETIEPWLQRIDLQRQCAEAVTNKYVKLSNYVKIR